MLLSGVCLTSVVVCMSVSLSVWLSVAKIGPTSRTERPIGRQNWHRCSPCHTWFGHEFQGQNVKGQGHPLYSPPCWRVRQLQRWAWERVGREKLLLRCRLLVHARRFGAHMRRREAGTYHGGRPTTACSLY